ELGDRLVRELPPVVGAHRLVGAVGAPAVKDEHDPLDPVRLDEKPALGAEQVGAGELESARREDARPAGDVEPIVVGDAERVVEERIEVPLEPPIRPRHDEDPRAVGAPFPASGHVTKAPAGGECRARPLLTGWAPPGPSARCRAWEGS